MLFWLGLLRRREGRKESIGGKRHADGDRRLGPSERLLPEGCRLHDRRLLRRRLHRGHDRDSARPAGAAAWPRRGLDGSDRRRRPGGYLRRGPRVRADDGQGGPADDVRGRPDHLRRRVGLAVLRGRAARAVRFGSSWALPSGRLFSRSSCPASGVDPYSRVSTRFGRWVSSLPTSPATSCKTPVPKPGAGCSRAARFRPASCCCGSAPPRLPAGSLERDASRRRDGYSRTTYTRMRASMTSWRSAATRPATVRFP